MFKFSFLADMDVNNSDHEQKQTSCIPKAGQNLPNNFTTVKKAKTPLKKHTKTPSPLRDEGKNNYFHTVKQYVNKNKL